VDDTGDGGEGVVDSRGDGGDLAVVDSTGDGGDV
jgi:hypothetical protein